MRLTGIISATVLLMASAVDASAYRDPSFGGLVGRARTGCAEFGCHTGQANAATSVSLTAGGAVTVQPGAKIALSAVVAHATQPSAGIAISVQNASNQNAGMLEPVSGLKLVSNQLFHTQPQTLSSGQATFDFAWTAPEQPGTYTMYIAGNAVNNNNSTSGDVWNRTQVTITVEAGSSVEDNPGIGRFESLPNPLVGQTVISIGFVQASTAELTIFDAAGMPVRRLAKDLRPDAGEEKNFIWDGRNDSGEPCTSGVYRAVIRTAAGMRSIPLVVIR